MHQEPSFDLPKPSTEATASVTAASAEVAVGQVQAETPQLAELPQASLPDPTMTGMGQPPALATSLVPSTSSAASFLTMAPDIAEDSDLIEREWVEKAKALVEQTKDDPYLQNKELTRFKADYIKKRYNKDVKVD